jgi:hypothetical protein
VEARAGDRPQHDHGEEVDRAEPRIEEDIDVRPFLGRTQPMVVVKEWCIYHDGEVFDALQVVRSVSILLTLITVPFQYPRLTRFSLKVSESFSETEITIILVVVDCLYLARTVLDAFFISFIDARGFRETDDKAIFKRFLR